MVSRMNIALIALAFASCSHNETAHKEVSKEMPQTNTISEFAKALVIDVKYGGYATPSIVTSQYESRPFTLHILHDNGSDLSQDALNSAIKKGDSIKFPLKPYILDLSQISTFYRKPIK
jgi:hypothetical protein